MSQIIAGYIKKHTSYLTYRFLAFALHLLKPISDKSKDRQSLCLIKKVWNYQSQNHSNSNWNPENFWLKKHIFGWRSELILYFEGYNYSNVHLYNYTFVTNSKLQIWCCGLGDKYTWFGCGLWLNKYLTMMIWVMK